jgi:hypothetical protein
MYTFCLVSLDIRNSRLNTVYTSVVYGSVSALTTPAVHLTNLYYIGLSAEVTLASRLFASLDVRYCTPLIYLDSRRSLSLYFVLGVVRLFTGITMGVRADSLRSAVRDVCIFLSFLHHTRC